MVYEDDFFNSVSEFALSPNGNYFAAVYMGDIYLLKNPDRYDETPDQNLARARKLVSSPGHEKELSWHHGSTQLAYVSDRDGQFELYTLDLTTMEEERLTYTPVEESAPQFDPVGDLICYYSGNREMRLMDTATGEDELLREGTFRWGPWVQGFAWAPDGYWLAYCEDFLDYQQEIFLINIEDKEPVNITRNPDWNGGVMFSPDGKWLAYTYSGETYTDVMLLPLDPEAAVYDTELLFAEDLPQPEDEDSAAEDEAADETAEPEDAEAGEAEDTVEPISIDFERIDERDYRAVRMNGDSYFYGFDPASSYLLFANDRMGYPQLWSYGLEDGSTSQLDGAVSDYYYFAPDGSRLYYLQGGRVAYLNMRGQDAAGGGSVDMLCEYGFDQYAIWEQVLREGWRVLDQGFYDGRMAGIDWEDVLARYYPLVREVGTPVEFGQLYREMLGELGRSHLSYYGYGNTREAPADTTGALGVDWAGDYDGPGWEVARVLPFTPADEPGSELYTGDIVLAINGEDLPRRANRGYWLRNTVGEVLTLTVENGPEAAEVLATAVGETREVEIMPVPSGMLSQVRYDMWVEANREYVYERSNERIGYQHIRKMYGEEADQFRIDLFSESADKDALIIDVRFNTGGYTAVDVMNIIEEQAAYLRKRRDAPEMNAGRAYVWEGPIVVLINAHSFSNAEIFAHIMKDAGLATIIGEPTPGGVISTSQYQLMDGSTISIPSGGNFRINGEDMEGPYKGVEPDILVLIEPEIAEAGGDNQLDAAVDFLLGEIS
jgi:tricorn protease